jgi:hypothetical protein
MPEKPTHDRLAAFHFMTAGWVWNAYGYWF